MHWAWGQLGHRDEQALSVPVGAHHPAQEVDTSSTEPYKPQEEVDVINSDSEELDL